jgi:hypothetical protein
MSNILSNRADALGEIRLLVADDAWTVRYALVVALQELDLGGVNRVLEQLEHLDKGTEESRRTHLQLLLQERWG